MSFLSKERTFTLKVTVFLIFTILIIYTLNGTPLVMLKEDDRYVHTKGDMESQYNLPPPKYLVWSDKCRMQDVNPFTDDAMKLFRKQKYRACSKELPITKAVFDIDSGTYRLVIDEVAIRKLIGNIDEVECCYQEVLRSGTGDKADFKYALKECVPFTNGYVLPLFLDGVIIRCMSDNWRTEVQNDAHFFVQEKQQIRCGFKSFDRKFNTTRPVSVLLWGIDSMSRFNLRRTMPRTTIQLQKENWFELRGYNKIDDNTFPNLMALLSGYKLTTVYNQCQPEEVGELEKCNLVWDLYRQFGYVSAYAEDETFMSTFNYNNFKGFKISPVDYYQRPYMLAIEKNLRIQKRSDLKYCIGLRHSAEYVYDFGIEFATRYKGEPYFGLFWTNTFSHNRFSDASSMDERIALYIDEMKERGILDDAIVILLSDHGSRFGPLMDLKEGFLENRLPFIFIWLPPWFREKHPEFVKALKINRHRLTNPYDIHMTLKHVLELSGRTGKLPQAVDCAKCQSVLIPVPEQRSCEDIGIDDHWCTCMPYETVNPSNEIVVNGAISILKHLNIYLIKGNFTPPCSLFSLNQVLEAQVKMPISLEHSNQFEKHSHDVYRIQFSTTLNEDVKLAASFSFSRTSGLYKLISSVSRLDAYKLTSGCIDNLKAKMYCVCEEYIGK